MALFNIGFALFNIVYGLWNLRRMLKVRKQEKELSHLIKQLKEFRSINESKREL